MNPIRKVIDRKAGTYTMNGFRPTRRWGYRCPHCGQEQISGGPYWGSRNSRKVAKDYYHRHLKNECPSRALVGRPVP